MSLPLAPHRDVRSDMDEAYGWYESRSVGLGEDFLAEVETVFRRIEASPEMYARIFRNIRAAPIHRFPYLVYYRIDADRITILAVQRGSRRARHWKRRM
jgi:plasmid stabilization system protein ParE